MNQRYRVLRPLLVHGRVAATGEVVRLPEYAAQEWIASGHLRDLDTGEVVPVNGSAWVEPTVR